MAARSRGLSIGTPERPDNEIGKLKMEPDRPKRSPGFPCHDAEIVGGPGRGTFRRAPMRTGRGVAGDDVRVGRPVEADETDLRLCRPIDEGGTGLG